MEMYNLFVQDVQIGGYDIPCGAMIVPMQWAVHTDPAYWHDPLEFRPDRFLSDNGTFFKPESFLPFQNGKIFLLLLYDIFPFLSLHFFSLIYFAFQRETRLRWRGIGQNDTVLVRRPNSTCVRSVCTTG